jgi:hypothetical protein
MTSFSTDLRQIRRFGLAGIVVFGLLGGLGYWRAKAVPAGFFSFLTLLCIGFLILPARFAPIYGAWMKAAHRIGRFFTAFILSLTYFLVITPFALVMRIFGKTALPVRQDKKVSSYWVPRSEPVQPKERFFKRY